MFLLSGALQSVGWPLCVSLMSNWFPKKGRGVIFGVWASCVNIGNMIGTGICALTANKGYSWEWTWIILAGLVGAVGILCLLFVIKKPEYVKLHVYENGEDDVLTQHEVEEIKSVRESHISEDEGESGEEEEEE
jgi:sugar phosphate permease